MEIIKRYIPANLEEALLELNKVILDSIRLDIITTNISHIHYHFSLGMLIRNKWRLWKQSTLTSYFNKLGITHADDMSSIILEAYFAKLRNQPFNLEDKIKYYQNFWEKQGEQNES